MSSGTSASRVPGSVLPSGSRVSSCISGVGLLLQPVAQLVLENLVHRIARHFGDEEPMLGNLVSRQLPRAGGAQLFLQGIIGRRAVGGLDEGGDGLAEPLIGLADDR